MNEILTNVWFNGAGLIFGLIYILPSACLFLPISISEPIISIYTFGGLSHHLPNFVLPPDLPKMEYNLGTVYKMGSHETSIDIERACYWFENAALDGHLPSHYLAGKCHEVLYQQKSLRKAKDWYRACAILGQKSCMNALETLGKLSDAALEPIIKDAEAGNIDQMYHAGMMLHPQSAQPDPETSYFWLEKAASQGHVRAQLAFGLFLWEGFLNPPNEKKALHWLLKAAESGNPEAQRNVGLIFLQSSSIQNVDQAAFWLKKASDNGDQTAMNLLSNLNS